MPRIPAIITVDHEEILESPRWAVDRLAGRIEGERVLQCAWGSARTLVQELMGYAANPDPTAGLVSLLLTEPHRFPWEPAMLARAAEITPFGRGTLDPTKSNAMTYPHARVRVTYATSEYGDANDLPTGEESLTPSVRFLTVGGSDLFWDRSGADGVDLADDLPGLAIRSLDYAVTIPEMPTLPSAVLDLVGTVNAAAWSSTRLGLTFAAETLMYQPPSLKRTVTAFGVGAWKAEFRFAYNPFGWNTFYRSSETETYAGGTRLAPQRVYAKPVTDGVTGAIITEAEPIDFYQLADMTPILNMLV